MLENNYYKPTDEEKKHMLMALLEQEIGYKRAHDLYDKAMEEYNPIEYAVQKARNNLEKR